MSTLALHWTESWSLTDVVILLGFAAVILDRVADARGWSRSSKVLRRENEDLVRINAELDKTVTELQAKVVVLEAKVSELQVRDQAAVLAALERHETNANARHLNYLDVLTDIRDNLKTGGTT
jgi:uncharacterized protein YlxW (UPF0749 family)